MLTSGARNSKKITSPCGSQKPNYSVSEKPSHNILLSRSSPDIGFLPLPGGIAICRVCWCMCVSFHSLVCSCVRCHNCVGPIISKTFGNRGSVPINHQQEIAYGESIHSRDRRHHLTRCGRAALHAPGGGWLIFLPMRAVLANSAGTWNEVIVKDSTKPQKYEASVSISYCYQKLHRSKDLRYGL